MCVEPRHAFTVRDAVMTNRWMTVSIAWLTWDELAKCAEHPLADEFGRYLAWKRTHSG
jgi:hypothetical protein